MKPVSTFEYFRLSKFSKPVEDRQLYKSIRKNKFRSIIEVGLGDGTRGEKLIRTAQKYGACGSIRYTGVDLFDGRPEDQPKLSLREMHKKLIALEAKIQLVPGDFRSALTRIANTHVRTDLILISAGQEEDALATSWFYIPRMLHAGSELMLQHRAGEKFKRLTRLEIEKMAETHSSSTDERSRAA